MFSQSSRGRLGRRAEWSAAGRIGDGIVAVQETEEGVEARSDQIFGRRRARIHGGDAGRDAFLIRIEFRRKIVRGRRFEADFSRW